VVAVGDEIGAAFAEGEFNDILDWGLLGEERFDVWREVTPVFLSDVCISRRLYSRSNKKAHTEHRPLHARPHADYTCSMY
jgi:hypothetical protein